MVGKNQSSRRDVLKRGGVLTGVALDAGAMSRSAAARRPLTGVSVVTHAGVKEGDSFTVTSDPVEHQCGDVGNRRYDVYPIEFPGHDTHLAVETSKCQPDVGTLYRVLDLSPGSLCSSASGTFDRITYREARGDAESR